MAITKDHYIQLKDGAFDGTTKEDLDNLFKALVADPRRDQVVLHFHGGLTGVESAMQTAESLTQLYQNITTYQIFFIWETAVSEVIQQEGGLLNFIEAQLKRIGKDEIFLQLLMQILQFAKGKIDSVSARGVRPIGGGLALPSEAVVWKQLLSLKDNQEPFADVDPVLPANEKLQDEEKQHFRNALAANQALQDELRKVMNEYRLRKQAKTSSAQSAMPGIGSRTSIATPSTLMSESILEQMDQQAMGVAAHEVGAWPGFNIFSGKAIEVLSHVITRFAQKTDHGLYPTVVEEILRVYYLSSVGKDVWDHIKRETVDAFSGPDRGGSVFLQNLRDYYQDSSHHPQITLVGHSAGAVYICELLQKAKGVLPPEVKFNVVFLAPACTYKLFADTLKACKDRIASIRVFAMRDRLEQVDVIVPGIYTRSLLYLVSGIFEDVADTPILGMERFFSTQAPFNKWPEVSDIFSYLHVSQRNNVWSVIDGGNGLSSKAQHHGDFYSEEVTLMSLGYILANGIL